MVNSRPVLVFDVNETLLDLTGLESFFEATLGDRRAMREWFSELILYSQALTLAGHYRPFGELAGAVLRMRAEIAGVTLRAKDIEAFGEVMSSMPAWADAAPALERLRGAGFRMVTLTNSSPGNSPTPLERAGIAHYFEAHFSVESVQCFKPAQTIYQRVAADLGIAPAGLCLVACHIWDTLGAQAAGWQSAFVKRPGNAPLALSDLPGPDYTADDLEALAEQLCSRFAGVPPR